MKNMMKVTAHTVENKVVYCRATSTEYKEPTPIEIIGWRMKEIEKDIRAMIKDAKEWGEDIQKNRRFIWLKDEYRFTQALLAEAIREYKPEEPTLKDLAAKFNNR